MGTPSKEQLPLSIIIVNYKSWNNIDRCLESLAQQKAVAQEVIVVDNASNDGQLATFKMRYPWVQWIENQENSGFAKGCNLGAQAAKQNWFLFLNPDTILPKECLITLLPYCEKHPEYHLIAIEQRNEKGKNTYPYGIFPKAWNVISFLRPIERWLVPKKSKYKIAKTPIGFPDWISGSFVLIRQTDFKSIDGWDERFWMYCEDIDLSKKAADKGLTRVVLNRWSCMHSHGGSSRINIAVKAMTKAEVIKSTFRYIEKHFSPIARLIAHSVLATTIGIELLLLAPFSRLKRRIALHLLGLLKR
ncbi:MAG: glycosyltransferase family 2 protein [Flavobacteriaceae bacterium]